MFALPLVCAVLALALALGPYLFPRVVLAGPLAPLSGGLDRLRLFAVAVLFLAAFGLAASGARAATPGVSANVIGRAVGSYTGSNGNGVPVFPYDLKDILQFSAGTGTGQADLMFSDKRTIAASGTDTLTLTGGSVKDPLGQGLTFGHLKAILVIADAGNTNNVVVGNATLHTFVGPFGGATNTVAIKPGQFFLITAGNDAGWGVTASSTDQLQFANSSSGSGVVYYVVLIGTST